MSIIGLNLPDDVCWERVCVSDDMVDRLACDTVLPPRWRSSIAVFRYVPAAEYQNHPGRKLIYYKVVCTVTGYQPRQDEITGAINFEGFRTSQVDDLEQRLATFMPCHGAAIQVSVAPADSGIAVANYPYFMDFQPKQRLLYEQASDTNERASRSLESLNVKKGGGTTQSQEVLDIDGGYSVGATAGANGVTGGFNYSQQMQRGTRNIASNETTDVRTTDATREARETLSHTTQITQMYNLLQAYHLGTNRALFYLAPRPHVLEEPSGFIRGPRVIDGIQEFFLVVNQPEAQSAPCLSVRLDTAHIDATQETDYEYREAFFPEGRPLTVQVQAPSGHSGDGQRPMSPSEIRTVMGPGWDTRYVCYAVTRQNTDTWSAPEGFALDPSRPIEDVPNVQPNYGRLPADSIAPIVTEGGRLVRLAVQATSYGGVERTNLDPTEVPVFSGLPYTLGSSPAASSRQLRLHLRSLQQTRVVRQRQRLFITSRMLCCCQEDSLAKSFAPRITAVYDLQDDLSASSGLLGDGDSARGLPAALTARQANLVAEVVSARTQRIVNSLPDDAPGLDAEVVLGKLTEAVSLSPSWQRTLQVTAQGAGFLSPTQVGALAQSLHRSPEELTLYDAAVAPGEMLERATGLTGDALVKLRLDLLRLPTRSQGGVALPTNGLLAAWNAAEGVTVDVNGHAASWQDGTGHGHNAIAGATPPLVVQQGPGGKPALRIAAAAGVAALTTPQACVPATGMGPRTLAFVGANFNPNGGADQLLFGYGAPNVGGFYVSDGAVVGTSQAPAFAVELGAGARLDTQVPYSSDARVVVVVFDGTNLKVRINGAQAASSAPTLATDGVPSIMWSGSWDCCAAAVYDRALAGADLAALEAALAQRGGVTLP